MMMMTFVFGCETELETTKHQVSVWPCGAWSNKNEPGISNSRRGAG